MGNVEGAVGGVQDLSGLNSDDRKAHLLCPSLHNGLHRVLAGGLQLGPQLMSLCILRTTEN